MNMKKKHKFILGGGLHKKNRLPPPRGQEGDTSIPQHSFYNLIGHNTYLAGKGRTYGVAYIYLDVSAVVLAAERAAVTVTACYATAFAGEVEGTQVNLVFLGHLHAIVCGVLVVPIRVE